jgi:tetratricopeptide (TPR) repeat protein
MPAPPPHLPKSAAEAHRPAAFFPELPMTDPFSSADPAARRRRIDEGLELINQGRPADALRLAEALRQEQPHDAEVQYFAAEARLAVDDPEGALACIEAAMALGKEDRVLLLKRAEVLLMVRRRADAKLTATRVVQLAPEDGENLRRAGRIFAASGHFVGARAIYERALALGHRDPRMMVELALAQQRTGASDLAAKAVAVLLDVTPQSGPLLYLRSTLQRPTQERNHIAALEALVAGPMRSEADRADALYALGHELEELGQPARAFAAIREGAALLKAQRRGYDAAKEIATVDALCRTYDAAEMARPVVGHDVEGPIFVVGLPRSGAALLEGILAAHAEVGAAGELLDFGQALVTAVRRAGVAPGQSLVDASLGIDFAALGQDYVRGAREAAPEGRRLFVDRLPSNYMYCGLIRRALPGARIVHVTRDPMDLGYSIFRTRFGGAYPYSCDQSEIADQIACHERTMRHWKTVVGGIETVRFEDLLVDPAGTARRMFEALGLSWESGWGAALGGVAGAGRIVGRSRAHQDDLAPLRRRLVENGVLPT